jgi:hypothetical protein
MGDAAIGSRIRDGVRRAVVCREAGWSSIWAVVIEAGREDVSVRLMLRELFSPKASVVRDYRYVRDVGYPTVTLGTPQPPIQVTPVRSAAALTRLTPLDRVQLL